MHPETDLAQTDDRLPSDGSDGSVRNSTQAVIWPLFLFVIVTLLWNAFCGTYPQWRLTGAALFLYFSLLSISGGLICGQLAVVAVICGLGGRTWFSGYAAAASLAVLGASAIAIGGTVYERWWNSWHVENDRWLSVVLNCPPVVLLASVSMIAFRILWGWRFTRRTDYQRASVFGITDLVLGTALVACLLMLGRTSAEFQEMRLEQYWSFLAIPSALLAFAFLIAAMPTLWILFRVKQRRTLKMLAFAVASTLVVSVVIALISGLSYAPQFPMFTVLSLTALWVSFAFAYFVAALTLLQLAGFQLQLRRDAVADIPATRTNHLDRFAAPAAVFIGLGLMHLAVNGWMIARSDYEAGLRQLQRDFAARGGKMDVENKRTVIGLALGAGATRDDLLKLREYPTLRELSLAGADIVDQDLRFLAASPYPNPYLGRIDLSDTALTDRGIDELFTSNFAPLSVSVANTKCTADGIGRLVEYKGFYKLDIGGLSLTDADLASIASRSNGQVQYLVLSGNPISNAGLLSLKGSNLGKFTSLDLTDCKVDENGLFLNTFEDLILDGTQVTEVGLAAKLPTMTVNQTLSFDRTAITDNILPSIAASRISRLRLGDTQITEQGLSGMGTVTLQHLSLNSRKFTGKCFENWKPNLSSLDMSHSGVTDETIANVVQLRGLGGLLDLSDTEVTDACLPLLAKTNAYLISLCDTKVTSEGIAKINWGFRRICISPAQFTEAELKPLLKRVDILIQTPSIKP